MDTYYDAIAQGYNRLHAEEQLRKLRLIAQHIRPIQPRDTLLDVGCGTGISTDFFADKCECTGIDPSAELIAQNTATKSTFVIGCAEQLPFTTNEFSVVISLTAIQNFTDVAQGLQEIQRVGTDTFVLTWLKKSAKREEIIQHVVSIFGQPSVVLDDVHDDIYVYQP